MLSLLKKSYTLHGSSALEKRTDSILPSPGLRIEVHSRNCENSQVLPALVSVDRGRLLVIIGLCGYKLDCRNVDFINFS